MKNWSKFKAYLLYGGTLFLIVSLVHMFFFYKALNISIVNSILDSLVFNLLFVVLTFSIRFPVKYITFTGNNFFKVFFAHLVASFFSSVLWYFAGYFLLVDVIKLTDYGIFLRGAIPWRVLIGMLYYFVIAAAFYSYMYYNIFQEKLNREAELNAFAREAELKSLKYQINPHFIFNSLNSIASLTISEPEQAQEMTVKLSTYLRTTLAAGEKTMCKLSEELRNARLYIEIEKVRFGEKIDYKETLSDECQDIIVPSLIIQPLLENAVKYGVYESLDKVGIHLACQLKDQYLKVSVENNFDTVSHKVEGEKIGLNNIRSRLDLIYDQDNLLNIEKKDNTFKVSVFIPLGEKAQ